MTNEAPIRPCVRSGFCCKKALCAFGEFNEDKTSCKHLASKIKGDGYEFFECLNHDFILTQPGNEWVVAFGEGCCMPIGNDLRRANIQALNDSKVDIYEVVDNKYLKPRQDDK